MYQWLKDYQNLSSEINYLEFNIERYEDELTRWTEGDLQDVHLNEKSKASHLEEIIQEHKRVLEMKQSQMQQLTKLIDRFEGLENKILKMKYVEGKTLISVADDLGKSPNYIYNKHAEIMRLIKFSEEQV